MITTLALGVAQDVARTAGSWYKKDGSTMQAIFAAGERGFSTSKVALLALERTIF